MSKHNRERKQLWKLGLSKRQVGRRLTNREIHERKKGTASTTPSRSTA